MNYPEPLDFDIHKIKAAQEVFESHQTTNKSIEETKNWLEENREDIYIFDAKDKNFSDWTTQDYCNNMSENEFEPYAIETENYIVMHDYI